MISATCSPRWVGAALLAVALSACQCRAPGEDDGGAPVFRTSPEVCDGIDNDRNGLVDDGPDGGPLTQPCPLTLGVCAGAASFCRDGGWAPCDYGPNYQLTERNCDGLDNDCDGRVDRSRRSLLLAADAGGLPLDRLIGWDTNFARVQALATGFWVVLPNMILVTDSDLQLQQRIDFPFGANNKSFLFEDGPDWVRITDDFRQSPLPSQSCITAHRVFGDGGLPLVDGGLALLGQFCWTNLYPYSALPVADGWFVVVTATQRGNGELGWAWLGHDGGTASGTIDAGLPPLTYPVAVGSRFLLTSFPTNSATEIREFIPSTQSIVPVLSLYGATCWPHDSTPPSYSCDFGWGGTTVYAMDGSPLATAFQCFDMGSPEHTDGLFVVAIDGGAYVPPAHATAAAITGGALVPFADLDHQTMYSVHNFSGRLHLATFNGALLGGSCPDCIIDGFYAEYVCTPP